MRVEKLTGGYPGVFIMKDISFDIYEGRVHGLLGLNGSGKSTLIKLICGLIKAESGNVLIDGTNVLDLNERSRARLISYVPQTSGLQFDMRVIDVVLMGITPHLGIFGFPAKTHIEQAVRCLDVMGIGNLAERNYQMLSGGQKQAVIIARALLQNGRYMLLDEPDSSLDLVNKHRFMKMIRNIAVVYGKGCLISMHDPVYAVNYCDTIILIKDGMTSVIDMKKEDINTVQRKLSEIYGVIDVIQYKEKYILDYA